MEGSSNEPTMRDLIEGAQRGDPVMTRLLDGMTTRLTAERARLDKVSADFRVKAEAIVAEQMEARAQLERDRIERERATLEAIESIKNVAHASQAAAAARDEQSAEREQRMVRMTDTLVKITWVLV